MEEGEGKKVEEEEEGKKGETDWGKNEKERGSCRGKIAVRPHRRKHTHTHAHTHTHTHTHTHSFSCVF